MARTTRRTPPRVGPPCPPGGKSCSTFRHLLSQPRGRVRPRKYIKKELEPILRKGLTVLCKHKPAKKLEATRFLAQWLLENNPNKGRVVERARRGRGGEEEDLS